MSSVCETAVISALLPHRKACNDNFVKCVTNV